MTHARLPVALRTSAAHVLVDSDPGLGDVLLLDGDVEHHLVRVLRLASGELITATDGCGTWREYVLAVDGRTVTATATDDAATIGRVGPMLTIASAIPKGDRVEWLVQKSTELGVDRIVFLHAGRSVVRWNPERAAKQLARLQRIADEALRQSRRVWRVTVDGPVDAEEVLAFAAAAEPGGRALESTDTTIAIGPEGGWTAAELERASALVDLTDSILRTETAAIAAITLSKSLDR